MMGSRSHAQFDGARSFADPPSEPGSPPAAGALPGCAGQQPAAPSSAGSVELWQLYQNSPAIPPLKDLLQQKHPQLQVNIVDVPGGQMPQKLTVATAGATAPDAMSVNAPFFRDCARFYQPIDSFLKRDAKKIDVDDWLPIGMQASAVKGKTTGPAARGGGTRVVVQQQPCWPSAASRRRCAPARRPRSSTRSWRRWPSA